MSVASSDEKTQASDRFAHTPSGSSSSKSESEPVDVRPGTRIGGYAVQERVGMGGMGVVFRATDPRLQRDVALKLLRVRKHSRVGNAKARMLREAQALARLSHPNVVPVYEVGWTDRGLFLAMEFVAGQTLREWLEAGPHAVRDVLEVMIQAGRGLEAAHEAGLVHRDFKPGNVLIGRDGRVRVTDFGLARRSGDSESAHDSDSPLARVESDFESSTDFRAFDRLEDLLTADNEVVGTPAYMAPEQVFKAGASPASDQYSFCVVLYEALYGARPFSAVRARDIRRRRTVPPAPTNSDVPDRLYRVIARGLDPDPEQRWPCMSDLLAAVAGHGNHRRRRMIVAAFGVGILGAWVVAVSLPGAGPICQDGADRFAGIWNAERKSAARAAILATKLPFAGRAWERVEVEIDSYVRRWGEAYTETCEATHVHGEQPEQMLDVRMACLADLRQELDATVTLLTEADDDVVEKAPYLLSQLSPIDSCDADRAIVSDPQVARDRGSDRISVEIRGKLARSRALGNAGRLETAQRLAEEALAQARARRDASLEMRARARLGDVLRNAGEYAEAEAQLQEAFFAAQELHADRLAAYTAAQLVLVVGDKLARIEDGLQWVRHGTIVLERLEQADDARAQLEHNTGSLLIRAGRFEEAKTHLEEALRLREQNLDSNRFPVGYILNELGNVYRNQGDHALAEQYYRRAYEVFEEALPPGHPNFGGLLLNLGNVAESAGKHELALKRYQKALEIWRGVYADDHPYVAGLLNNIGTSLDSMERYEEAAEYFERARVAWSDKLGPDHPMVGTALTNLGNCAAAENRWEDAAEYYAEALRILEGSYDSDHPDLAHPLVGLGASLLELDRSAEAVDALERVVSMHEAQPLAPPNGALGRFLLARALWILDADRPRALRLAQRARAEFDQMGPAASENLDTVNQWLSEHSPDDL
jgi:tetratricopeptide (TPR) repeat protein/predicted Ser/Thr protein kinase